MTPEQRTASQIRRAEKMREYNRKSNAKRAAKTKALREKLANTARGFIAPPLDLYMPELRWTVREGAEKALQLPSRGMGA